MRRVLALMVAAAGLAAASPSGAATVVVLGSHDLAGVALGAPATSVVRALTRQIGAAPSTRRTPDEVACGVTTTESWGSLTIDVRGRTFVGYTDGPSGRRVSAQTATGLRLGSRLSVARVLYPTLATSFAQGGSYRVATHAGTIAGFLSAEPTSARVAVASIGAGVQGCPAMSP